MAAQRMIKALYKYDHCHDATLIKDTMKRLATADKQRDRAAIAALPRFVHMATDKLKVLMDTSNSNRLSVSDKSAMAATLDSKSLAERPARRGGAFHLAIAHVVDTLTIRLAHEAMHQQGEE
jgi:hypothetical protein